MVWSINAHGVESRVCVCEQQKGVFVCEFVVWRSKVRFVINTCAAVILIKEGKHHLFCCQGGQQRGSTRQRQARAVA